MGEDHVVYALKFVQLAGQKPHAVIAFRCEHVLLKSLQGQPHVIQMIASQVRLRLAPPQYGHWQAELSGAAMCKHGGWNIL